MVCVGWTLAMSTNFGLVHALYGRLLGTLASAAYVALSHTLWAVTIAWILIACTSGHGGNIRYSIKKNCIQKIKLVKKK